MVYVMLHANHTLTDQFFPFFEVVYTVELLFIFFFYSIAPTTIYVLWNARPFHRNLRLSLCNLVVQGLLGTTARLIFIYNQYVDNGPYDHRPSVVVGSFIRFSMYDSFVGAVAFFSVERLIATFAWSWYEKVTPGSILVFIVLESCSVMSAWFWSLAITFEFIKSKHYLAGIVITTAVGGVIGAVVLLLNFRELARAQSGPQINRYSIARVYQIRENVTILKALGRIAIGVMLLNVPVFILSICHLYLSDLSSRMITRAIFDLVISIYPAAIISYIPLSDVIFERSLKRMHRGQQVFNILEKLHCKRAKQPKVASAVANETDAYFDMLNQSISGPQTR